MSRKLSRPSAAAGWKPPADVEEYRIVEPLGRGRVGRVFLAHDTLLDRVVAVKFLPVPDDLWFARFILEARAIARIQHPNVITLYRVGQQETFAYLVSEYVRGTGLDRLPRPVEGRRVAELALGLARGLSAAHRGGVLHRDIKPANAVLAESGEVKLLDFGLAKLLGPPPRPSELARALEQSPSADPNESPRELTAGWIGTPYFMAPEIWRGEEAQPASDLFSLGILLYELCAGNGPFRDVPAKSLPDVVQTREARPLAEMVAGIDPRFAKIVDRCIRKEPSERFRSADALVDALEALFASSERVDLPGGNPYRGLQAFDAEHRSLFFGRTRDARACVDRLRADSFLLITGDSGVGKSSLCMAGILPELEAGALGEGRTWVSERMVPGRRPLFALASALAGMLGGSDEELERALRADPVEMVRKLRKRLGGGEGFALYVDQLEELVTLAEPEQAELAARVLGELSVGFGGVKVVASARSDFLTRLAHLPGLGESVPRALYLLRGLSPEQTREAIVGPALLKGARFESEALVDGLVREARVAEGGLPLLQFALAELWEGRERADGEEVITSAALARVGGVSGALARHAEGVFGALLPERRKVARTVLLRLVTFEGTRARRTRAELEASLEVEAAREVVEALVRGRLLVARDEGDGAQIEIAHEALISGWERLSGWLSEENESRALQAQVAQAAAEWVRAGQAKDALWRAAQLSRAKGVDLDSLEPFEREFLRASDAALRRSRRRRRVGVVLFVASLFAVYAGVKLESHLTATHRVDTQLDRARRALRTARAQVSALWAARAAALRQFDSGHFSKGNEAWQKVERLRARAQSAFSSAQQAFEKALVLGRGRIDVQRAFADVLLARAALADRLHRFSFRDELLERMRLYDDGSRWKKWNAPARLEVRTSPPGARLELDRILQKPDAPWPEVPVRALTAGETTLPTGDYVLVASAPGHATVRDPILLGRGEMRSIELALPKASEVPKGFVYVPKGRFLFGTTAPTSIREFFETVPIHSRETGPYLIARHETTYAQWIAFLDALPPAERARRLPRAAATGMSGQVRLEQVKGNWRLELSVGATPYVLDEGQPLVYAARASHRAQQWSRLPVSGISFADAEAYVKWLASTGRVPKARLCTEAEWERAARGADARLFPEGDRLAPGDADFDRTYGKRADTIGPDDVGTHPGSRSPFGVDDMAGNVWEWVTSVLTPGQVVVRGGSYYSNSNTCRVVNRETPENSFRAPIVGFRVCADL